MALLGIDHVQLAAPPGCEEAARYFFGELLGLPELAKPAALAARGGVWFEVGSQQLHVGVAADQVPARKAHPAFAIADSDALESLAAALKRAGHDVSWDDELQGVRRFYVDDPWGNRLELLAAGDA
jgi:catechol 2,3-dioxygenase-like lactoylglutathione lyase family enzyme